ncbi:hypothetical protein DIS18_02315 [Algibacter marinivivus]|uniref:Calx-beta domain-containing protein n=1 Tax=Algibacter marinivivus TaxID=2100723 RepID=A0A2U2X6K0_9FLAO|nr:hypothetical protein [Algibacter marinivivus]PWH83409.1 hypothetical protein DIS18_02315 [Algibacter marinivivus]
MKKIKYILNLAIVALLIVGCDAEKASVDPADIGSTSRYPTPTFTLTGGNTTVNENNQTVFTYNIVLDKPISEAIDFSIVQTGGNATLHEDFEVENGTIAAYTTSTQVMVMILDDEEIEGTETAELTIESGPSLANKFLVNPNTSFPSTTFTIQNSETDDFKVQLDWDAIYLDSDGDEHHLCDMDLDLEIYTADFSGIVATSYSSCPEGIRIPAGALADGNYWLVPSFWSTAGAVPPATNIDIPAMITFAQVGVTDSTDDLTGVWDTDTGGDRQGNADAYLVRYVLNISGTSYTVTNVDSGAVVFQN